MFYWQASRLLEAALHLSSAEINPWMLDQPPMRPSLKVAQGNHKLRDASR